MESTIDLRGGRPLGPGGTSRPVGRERPSILVFGLALLAIACGDDAREPERTPSMLGAAGAPTATSGGENRPPVVEAIELRPARPVPGRKVIANARVVDPEGNPTRVSYVWQTTSGRVLGEGRSFDTTGLREGDRVEVVAIAEDGAASSEPFAHRFRLAEASLEIALVAIDDEAGRKPGAVLRGVVETTNDRGGRFDVVYEWLVDGQVVGSEEELDTSALSPGDAVVLRARLETDGRPSRPVSSRPVVLTRGDAPKIVSQPSGGIEDGVFRYRVRAESAEPGAKLRYSLLQAPDGMTIDAITGVVEWRPPSGERGVFPVDVAATDQWGTGAAQSFEIRLDPPKGSPAAPR